MPIYEFACNICEAKFEEFFISYKHDIPNCPSCNKNNVRKLISRVSCDVKGTENKTLDQVVGADAEKRWEKIHKRKEKLDKKRKNINKRKGK